MGAMGTGLGFVRYTGHVRSPQERFIRDLGEYMMENDGNSSKQTVKAGPLTQIVGKGTEADLTSKIHSLPKYANVSAEKSVAKSKQGSSIDEFSYMKVVKDDRIRRELEEQEAREAEVRERVNGSLDSEMIVPISSATGYNKTVKGQRTTGGSSSVKLEQHVSEPLNTPFQYSTQNERLKKEMEKEKKRDDELKSRKIDKE